MNYAADTETTTIENDCRVWAYSLCEIADGYETKVGTSLDEMFEYVSNKNCTLYFHNLKFDGEFIFYWLFNNGYTHVKTRSDLHEKSFTTLISDTGVFYSMKICHKLKGKNKICTTIIDSLKILHFSVDDIAKAFKLPFQKLSIDYKAERPVGYQLTDEEKEYCKNDVRIVAMALDIMFKQGLKKSTQGADALYDYKKMVGLKFRDWFPIIDKTMDNDIRQAYKGGFTYLNPRFKNKELGDISVFDVNSLYPSQMYNRPLPCGYPIHFTGKYNLVESYPLYVQMLRCQFKLKSGYIPTIQLKNTMSFVSTEYLTSSKGNPVALCLTSVDLELFMEHYDVYDIEYLGGYAFHQRVGMFKEYIDKWMKVKEEATLEGNSGMRTLAKLMLNALYGKFGTRIECQSKFPYYEDELVKYKLGPKEEREPIYIPMACFITAWARYTTITNAQKVYDRFVYADTDSLHLIGHNIPEDLDVDTTRLGAWDYEMQADKAKFLRAKTYIEHPCGKSADSYKKKSTELYELCNGWKITCAGMPSGCYKYVTVKNFKVGSSFSGKLQARRVKGGVVLNEIEFTIKP